jgi:hypothetical protein
MRNLFAAALLCLPVAARGEHLELELDGGAAYNPEGPTAPIVSLRFGGDTWSFLAPGIRATAVLGEEGVQIVSDSTPDGSGNRAWSLLAELRLHSPGRLQAFLDLGAGVGNLVRLQNGVFDSRAGSVGPAFRIGVGVRGYVTPRFALGLGLAAPIWTGVRPDTPAPPGTARPATTLGELALCGSITLPIDP